VYGTRFANIDELKCKFIREWAKLDHEIIASVIRQWRRRHYGLWDCWWRTLWASPL